MDYFEARDWREKIFELYTQANELMELARAEERAYREWVKQNTVIPAIRQFA